MAEGVKSPEIINLCFIKIKTRSVYLAKKYHQANE